jgi:hypothetical protein
MEKTSIALAWKNGEMKILATGDADSVLAAYREAELDQTNDFVGMLRKPVWYKRNTPARNKARHEESLKVIEKDEVDASRSESQEIAAKAKADADLAYEAKVEADRLEAERIEEQMKLNQGLAEMEQKERDQQAAADDERMFAAQESIVEVSPSTEMERAAKKKK